jgi:hypothetical protein
MQPSQYTFTPVEYKLHIDLTDLAVMFNISECNVIKDNDIRGDNSMRVRNAIMHESSCFVEVVFVNYLTPHLHQQQFNSGYMPLRADNAQVDITLDFLKFQPIQRYTPIRIKVFSVA